MDAIKQEGASGEFTEDKMKRLARFAIASLDNTTAMGITELGRDCCLHHKSHTADLIELGATPDMEAQILQLSYSPAEFAKYQTIVNRLLLERAAAYRAANPQAAIDQHQDFADMVAASNMILILARTILDRRSPKEKDLSTELSELLNLFGFDSDVFVVQF